MPTENKTSDSFGSLFRKLRLKAGIATLKDFGNLLADYGYPYEDSMFSHWQKGNKIPKRNILLASIAIFKEKNPHLTIDEANKLLAAANKGYLTESEIERITKYPIAERNQPTPKKIVEFLNKTVKAKQVIRSGWIRKEIKDPENVAEHSFQLIILATLLAEELSVDKEKLIKMTILHILGEMITGDLIWYSQEGINFKKQTEKEKLERKGIEKLFKIIGDSEEYLSLFKEMTDKKSRESTIFLQLDKLEMAIQALEYEKNQNKNLNEFFISADLQIQSPLLRKIFKEIIKQRPKR